MPGKHIIGSVNELWGIEGKVYRILDVICNEDECILGKDHSAGNKSIIGRRELNMLRLQSSKQSLNTRHKRTGRSLQYLGSLLGSICGKNYGDFDMTDLRLLMTQGLFHLEKLFLKFSK